MNFTAAINQVKINEANTQAQVTNNRVRRNIATEPEMIAVVQVGKNASGQVYGYAISGGFAPGREIVDTDGMKAAPFPEGSTREMILAGICQLATAVVKDNTKAGRKTNLRLVMYDNMAIKHFAMLSAQKNQESVIERMTAGFEYSDATKAALEAYVDAVQEFLEVTGKNLLVETYRSQRYWDIDVPEDCTDKVEAGTILKFQDNDCTNVPGIKFSQSWHRGQSQYAVHVDVGTRYNQDGSLVLDENGKPEQYIRGYAVVRPLIEKDGKRVPKNAKCRFVTEKLAGFAKEHLPETKVISGDAAKAALQDFM